MVQNDGNNNVPRVLNPYKDTYEKYLKAGFRGPLPIPYKDKFPPPVDFTGQRAPYPGLEDFEEWCNDGKKHNICVRLAGVDEHHELIGIDVDDYPKGGKKKEGYSQLQKLETTLGTLPPTWISSARTDGKSGIRYFRVPRGLAFRGKVDKDIEVIRKGHRFAVVWPSIHPEGGIYWWFAPSVSPGKSERTLWNGVLPDARKMPLLPEKWIDFLTSGGTLAVEDEIIDVDSAVQEIYDWATDTFHKDDCRHPDLDENGQLFECDESTACGDFTLPCELMRSKLDKHLRLIEDEATSHDKLTNAHWNLLHLAFEGHLGWNAAINELEQKFEEITVARGKRGLSEVHGEIFRSRIQALRQIKGKSDERRKIGAKAVDPLCIKVGICGSKSPKLSVVSSGSDVSHNSGVLAGDASDQRNSLSSLDSDNDGSLDPPDELDDVPKGALKAIEEYETNDDGNAAHFVDMFSSLAHGPSVRFAEGYGWIVWHDGSSDVESHWQRDELGNQQVRRMWHKVKERQKAYVDALKADFDNKLQAAISGGQPTSGQNAPADLILARAKYQKWQKWAELSGNNRQAENALKAATSITGVSISVNDLDKNEMLLGVANGVVELDRDEVRLRKAQLDDFITLNTNIKWEQPTDFAAQKWQEYLDTFLPDPELQRIVQVVLGHTIIGGNPEKIMVVLKGDPNTGKSTMISALESALGDYAQSVNQTIFQNHKLNPVLANSLTKRIIVCSEFDEKDQLSASQVKRLTGGSDKIQAELKGSNTTIEGVPQFVPILATNAVPQISGADKALRNRLLVIPFDVTPRNIDKSFSRVVKDVCATAVLSWLIDGYKQYRNLGELPTSKLIEAETDDFVNGLDHISTFASQCLTKVGVESYLRPKDVKIKYLEWCDLNNIQRKDTASQPLLTRRLKALDFPQKQKKVNGIVDNYFLNVKFTGSNVIPFDKSSADSGMNNGTK